MLSQLSTAQGQILTVKLGLDRLEYENAKVEARMRQVAQYIVFPTFPQKKL